MSRYVKLDDWLHLKVSGPQTIEYLNGIITIDLNHVEKNNLVRSAFLTPNAKIRSVFWLRKKDNVVYIYCPGQMRDALIEDLLKYKLKMDVKLEDVTEEVDPLYLVETMEEQVPGLSYEARGFTIKTLDEEPDGEEMTYNEFTNMLVEYGVTPPEIMAGENPYEIGIEDAISLEKGCFLGQEPISRMYHRGNPRKYVYQVQFKEGQEGSIIKKGDKEVGEVLIRTKDQKKGLAYIRRQVENFDNLTLDKQNIKVFSRVGNFPPNTR